MVRQDFLLGGDKLLLEDLQELQATRGNWVQEVRWNSEIAGEKRGLRGAGEKWVGRAGRDTWGHLLSEDCWGPKETLKSLGKGVSLENMGWLNFQVEKKRKDRRKKRGVNENVAFPVGLQKKPKQQKTKNPAAFCFFFAQQG